jgi:hypothetical protein
VRTSIALMALAGCLLTGCTTQVAGTATPADPTNFTLSGWFVLYDEDLTSSCIGSSGYDDIRDGAAVTVYDDAQKVVGLGSLGAGDYDDGSCEYPIAVDAVPLGSDFYAVEITHRGTVTVTADEAKAGMFDASLG